MRSLNLSYGLVAAFVLHVLLVMSKNSIIQKKEACEFASSCVCRKVPGSQLLKADCANKNLSRIPKIPNVLKYLSLQMNSFYHIEDGIFAENFLLEYLDLSFNRLLSKLGKKSFKGLTNLQSLNLSNNGIKYFYLPFDSRAFDLLENLKHLNLKNNFEYLFVPDFSKLTSLEILSMDYVTNTTAVFGETFAYLKRLTVIDLSGFTGYCTMNILTPQTFLFLPQITHLNISGCKLQYIYDGTFRNMKNISELDVSFNACLKLPALENITTDLQNSAIKVLKVNYIHGVFAMSTVLKTSHIVNLKNTSLVRFEAAGNRIQRIESGALQNFPDSLESADFRDNVFSIGIYMLDLMDMHITFLDLSDSYSSHNIRTFYVDYCIPQENTVTMNSDIDWKKALHLYQMRIPEIFVFMIPLPHKLRTFFFTSSTLKYEIPQFSFTANELNSVSFSKNIFHTWTGPVYNVRNLTFLYLSSNFCSNVSNKFFSGDFMNLRHLLLQDNLLGLVIPMDSDGLIFKNLHNVITVNLSNNKITNIQRLFLKKQWHLERLDISGNMIDDINFKISHMKKLNFLDVRNNKISKLSSYAMDEMDLVAKTNTNLTIDLGGNNLVCNCDSLSFIQWMINTHTHLYRRKKYKCKLSNDTTIILRNLKEVYKIIKKECMSYAGIIFGITTGILIFISILFGGISYRFRWKLRYLYYMVKVKWHQNYDESDNKDDRMYMYDAFVSYAEEDKTFVHNILLHKLEKDGGIQLCLHKRNFLPGNDIATNITSAIHNSRKTIVLMSPNYLASYWCMFEYNMARMESIYERNCENILFLVFYEPISVCDLPLQILELVHSQSYIEYPNDEYGDVVFWEQLQKAIKSH